MEKILEKKSIQSILMVLLLSLCACSSTSHKNEKTIKEDKRLESKELVLVPNDLEHIENKLSLSIQKAKAQGTEAVDLLSDDLFLKANDASIRGDSATALLLFKYLCELKPADLFIKQKYSVELIKVGKLEEALVPLQEAFLAEQEKGEMTGLILAGVYSALELPKLAKSIYHKVLKANPKSEEACVFLAKAYAADNQFKAANSYLAKCAKSAQRKSIFYYYQGKLALNQGHKKSAKHFFQKAWKEDSSFYQAVLGLGLLEEEKARFLKAAQIYKKFLDQEPDNNVILERLVNIYFAEGKFKEVIPYAQRLSQIDAQNLNLKLRLGILYTEAKQFDDAIGIFKEILVEAPDSDKILYYLGSLYQQKGVFDQAIEHFAKIPPSSPLYHDTSLQMAQLLYVNSQKMSEGEQKHSVSENAFISFVEARAKGDLELELNMILADYFEAMGRPKDAVAKIEASRSLKGFNDHHHYYLASLLERVGDVQGSRKIILSILDRDPENAHALNFLGYSYLEEGENLDQAYSLISKAVKINPEDGYIRDSMGWYYYKIGKYEKALSEIKKAQKLVSSDVVITKHLGIVYQAMKSYDNAKKYFLEALKHCKVESERRDVMRSIETLKSKLEDQRLPASK